jgi:predicted DNA-binding mobile mystery protein A
MDCMKKDMAEIIRRGLEQRLPTLRAAQVAARKPARGWLRAVRDAVGLSQHEVASRLGVTRQSYAGLETAEACGAISLNSLERAAGAMDCELVLFLVPRESAARSFGDLARRHDPDFKHLQASEHSMLLEGQAVGDLKPKATRSGGPGGPALPSDIDASNETPTA